MDFRPRLISSSITLVRLTIRAAFANWIIFLWCLDLSKYERRLLFKSFALNKNLDALLALWSEIFRKPRFDDPERIKTLLGNVCGFDISLISVHFSLRNRCRLSRRSKTR